MTFRKGHGTIAPAVRKRMSRRAERKPQLQIHYTLADLKLH